MLCSVHPDQGSNPCPLPWKCSVLTTRLPEKSLYIIEWFFFFLKLLSQNSLVRQTQNKTPKFITYLLHMGFVKARNGKSRKYHVTIKQAAFFSHPEIVEETVILGWNWIYTWFEQRTWQGPLASRMVYVWGAWFGESGGGILCRTVWLF